MAYSCQYCLKSFKRSYNRNRHEKQGCRLAYQPKENATMTTISPENELLTSFQMMIKIMKRLTGESKAVVKWKMKSMIHGKISVKKQN